MPADNSCITLEGDWTHKLIQANGAQFHIAHAGTYTQGRPLILLVHGFPQYWWAWRNQIKPLADAGYEVVAIDKRGFGGSDKTPNSADGLILANDISAIVRSLGYSQAVVVGLGRGATLAWSAVSSTPELFTGLVTVSSPHPRTLHRIGTHLTLRTWRYALGAFVTPLSKYKLQEEKTIKKMLQTWSAPKNTGASSQADIYTEAMKLPGAADAAVSQLKWILLSQQSISGRKYLRESANKINIPVLAVRGKLDPLLPKRAWIKDTEFSQGRYEFLEIANAGHFVPEEQPEIFTKHLIDFVNSL